jgi:elongation factor G
MKQDDSKPKTMPAGNRPPPRPPGRTAIALGPGDDGSGEKWKATIAEAVNGEGRFIRKSGGRDQYGHVVIIVEPNGTGRGIKIIKEVPDSVIPSKYLTALVLGVRTSIGSDMVVGHAQHPIDDIVVRVVGGSFHQTDSSDLAFTMAIILAMNDAMKKAEPIKIK